MCKRSPHEAGLTPSQSSLVRATAAAFYYYCQHLHLSNITLPFSHLRIPAAYRPNASFPSPLRGPASPEAQMEPSFPGDLPQSPPPPLPFLGGPCSLTAAATSLHP